MILRVTSSLPTFKTIEFTPGFNVVLADRTKASTRTDTRNGLGKSTLLDVIHFCLGARFTSASTRLAHPDLYGVSFTLELVMFGKNIAATRRTDQPETIYVSGDADNLPLPEQNLFGDKLRQLSVSEWLHFLGQYWFSMPVDADYKYRPSFRSCISYFMRAEKDAFDDPFRHFRLQSTWDIQVNTAFLLGLTWQDASEGQILRERKKALELLKAAAEEGFLGNIWGARGKLEADRIRLEDSIKKISTDLKKFRVLSQYRQLEEQANSLTREGEELSNENATDAKLLEMYQDSVHQEQITSRESVLAMYEAVNVEFAQNVKRSLAEVEVFQKNVIQNRRKFLEREIASLESAIASRRKRLDEIHSEHARLLDILNSHGALEQYAAMQQEHLRDVAKLQDVNRRLALVKRVEEGKGDVKIDSATLAQRARQHYDDDYPQRQFAIGSFDAGAHALYGCTGRLILDISDAGFRFDTEIDRKGSTGMSYMEIFCYDITLARIWAMKRQSATVLFHDSNIFADVDDRQVAHALELAASDAEQLGFQYICTLNSDKLPAGEFSAGFSLEPYVRLRLTDETREGGLLGVRLPSQLRKTKSKAAKQKFAFSG